MLKYKICTAIIVASTSLLLGESVACGQVCMALQPASNSQSALDPPKGTRLISLEEMNLPGIDGTTIRYRKTWPWSFVDNCAATVAQAKAIAADGDVAAICPAPLIRAGVKAEELLN